MPQATSFRCALDIGVKPLWEGHSEIAKTSGLKQNMPQATSSQLLIEFYWGRTPSYCMNFSLSHIKAVENILSNCRNGINKF